MRRRCVYRRRMVDEISIRLRYEAMRGRLDERSRGLFAAAEARTAGHGGIAGVARATGIARSTIGRGLKDLAKSECAEGTVRRAGGGRRPLAQTDATLLEGMRRIIEPSTLGDPMRPLLRVLKSHAKLGNGAARQGPQPPCAEALRATPIK